ncbi:MAG: glycosyltransferase [Chromatiales bacterium]
MRVLHLLASTGWGGAERIGCTLHRLAREHGHESFVDAPALPAIVEGVERESGDRLPGAAVEADLRRWVYGALRRRRQFRPHVVHAHLAWPAYASTVSLIAGKAPLAVTFHLLPASDDNPQRDFLLPIDCYRLLRWSRLAQPRRTLVTVSQADAPRVARLFPADDVCAIQNVPPLPPRTSGTAPSVTWPEDAVKLLSVGRLHAQKGFDRLLAALADPGVRALRWHWVLIGDGQERSAIERAVEQNGLSSKITVVGARPAHAAFAGADLVLSPSRFEGMPLVPLEGIEARVPVLLSRIPSHLELLGDVPESFLPDDESQWPAHLGRLVAESDQRVRLLDRQAAVVPRLSRDRFWQSYARVYENLVKGP